MKTAINVLESEFRCAGPAITAATSVNAVNALTTDSTPSQFRDALEAVFPPGSAAPFRPLRLFVGRQLRRVCPVKERAGICEHCRFRALCRCAQTDFAAALEAKIWVTLAACGGVAILCLLLSFLRPGWGAADTVAWRAVVATHLVQPNFPRRLRVASDWPEPLRH